MAESTSTELALASDEFSKMPDQQEQKSGFLGSVGGMDMVRQISLIVALTICIAIAVLIILWAREPEMRPLGTFETQELITTLDYLDAQKIDYKLEGSTILVNGDEYQNIKLDMVRAGVQQQQSSGDEILMQDSGFGVSQRLETERLKHSREQQLARTIEQMQNVASARVLPARLPAMARTGMI